MWLFQYFVKKNTKAFLSARETTKKDLRSKDRRKLTSYAQVVKYLLRAYATDKITAEDDADINQFR